jgi:hypothetical protein
VHESPEIPFVEFDPVFEKERHVFLLERTRPMVFGLTSNVCRNVGKIGAADGEGAVSLLPGEAVLADRVVTPGRCTFLQIAKEVGDAMRGSQSHEQMDVVLDTSNLESYTPKMADSPSENGVKLRAPSWIDEWPAVFGREYEVVVKADMCGRHFVPPFRSSLGDKERRRRSTSRGTLALVEMARRQLFSGV